MRRKLSYRSAARRAARRQGVTRRCYLANIESGHLVLKANHMGTLLALMATDGTEVNHIHELLFFSEISTIGTLYYVM